MLHSTEKCAIQSMSQQIVVHLTRKRDIFRGIISYKRLVEHDEIVFDMKHKSQSSLNETLYEFPYSLLTCFRP